MKPQCTIFAASRGFRFSLWAAVLTGLMALAPAASFAASSVSSTGQALALAAALRAPRSQAGPTRLASAPAVQRTPDGRILLPRTMMHGNAGLHPRDTTTGTTGTSATGGTSSNTVPIPGGVQTLDVNNPPPAFQPIVGFRNDDGSIGNNPFNGPFLQPDNALLPTNLTPVWSQDETFLVFSSNRTLNGRIQPDGRFHLWAISVSGGEAFQITTSAAQMGDDPTRAHGEFFPALSFNNQKIAFTSDAQSSNIQNLYTLQFSFSLTVGNNNAPAGLSNVSDPNAFSSLTMRPNDAFGFPGTGFDQVQRPTISPVNDGLIVFSAHSVTGTFKNHYHIYFLNQNTRGFDPNNTSFPGKLTDGPADDTDPAYSKDGQFIAIASTAGRIDNQANGNNSFGPTDPSTEQDPNNSQSLTSAVDPAGLRSLFLISGGSGNNNAPGFGTIASTLQTAGGRITQAGTDNFGPAWSFLTTNQYTNPAPGFEYLAFARGASPAAPHDIFYLQTVRYINSGGEGGRSNEAATTPQPINTPIYQIDSGGISFANGLNVGNYGPESFVTANGLTTNLVFGGAAGVDNGSLVNTANDPGTPQGIFNTDRDGAFTYILPNLTPNAPYTVRLHLADPTSTAPGQRVFNIQINNGGQNPVDIVQLAQGAPGRIGGLIRDNTGAVLAGATVTVTTAAGRAVTTNPTPVTSTATPVATPAPAGDNGPTNFTASLPAGSDNVTVSAPGFGTQTRTITVSSNIFARADFNLAPNNATLTGTVTNAVTTAALSPVAITVTDPVSNAIVATATTQPDGTYTVPVPAGTFNVTANPGTPSGIAARTFPDTFTAGATTRQNFGLASGAAAVGTLGGLITDVATGAPLAGVTVTVTGAGYQAIVTSGASTSPGAPQGNGAPQNFNVNLPAVATPGTPYTVTFTLPGFTQQQPTVNVIAGAFARQDAPLVRVGGAVTGQNTAVVASFTTTATGADQLITTLVPNQRVRAGAIIIQFTPNIGVPLVQGIEILSNTQPATSSGFGGQTPNNNNNFNFTFATATAPSNLTAIGGDGQVTLNFNAPFTATPPTFFNIFRSPATAASATTVNVPGSGSGTEGNIPFATTTSTTYVDRQNVQDGNEYFYQVSAVFQQTITPETGAAGANRALKLNTDDNAGQTSAAGNVYDDIYPTWAPFLSIFSIAYSSNRTVTYNDPTTSFPSETAISVGRNGSVVTSDPNQPVYTIGTTYSGIFESQVLNLDPPTLLRFSPDEIVHVQSGQVPDPVRGTPNKLAATGGQPVTLTVRLSDREAGINDTGGPNGGPRVYVQLKDPDGKYADAQNLEHKVFAKDDFFNNQSNQNINDITSGSANDILGNNGFPFFGQPNIATQFSYPDYGRPPVVQYVFPRGAHGGHYPAGAYIFIGKNGGGNNTFTTTSAGTGATTAQLTGGDPNLFIPWGPEYEAQLLNPQFATSNAQNGTPDSHPNDYRTPYWLAGVDDQQAFSGGTFGTGAPATTNSTPDGITQTDRATANSQDAAGNPVPAEWLQLQRVPAALQDNRGGVLYTVTFTTPASGSDFYVDVIAYDKAVFPDFPLGTSTYSGHKTNWRIYDNVGGFSTVQSIGNNDILLVSDYALGQKFAATTFSGQNANLNLVPKLFGTESYLTDVDVNILPDRVFAGFPTTPTSFIFEPFLVPFFGTGQDQNGGLFTPYAAAGVVTTHQNGLGVGSYFDNVIDDGGREDGVPAVRSQAYSIWRILSRGPVPDSVLNAYLPTRQPQPAVIDTQSPDARFKNVPAATVLDAHRCVIWLSPYTGDMLVDPGTMDDPGVTNRPGAPDRPSTQKNLRNFVLGDGTSAHPGGGRLFVTGQDIGSALTLSGTLANGTGGFLSDVLNATLSSPDGGTNVITGTANRITGTPMFDNSSPGIYLTVTGTYGNFGFGNPNFPYQDDLVLGNRDYNDGSLSQVPPQTLPTGASIQARIDTLTPTNGATVAATYNGTIVAAPGNAALIYHDDPFGLPSKGAALPAGATTAPVPNGGTGSRVVYAGFGIEGLSNDYFTPVDPSQDTTVPLTPIVPAILPRNPRPELLHNIVCFLRTGSVSGTITQTAGTGRGAGQGVPGVTVYLQSGATPSTRATFSATTSQDGKFSIVGVEPGTYTLVAYKPGFTRAIGNVNTTFPVEGDVNVIGKTLTVTPLPPGAITGAVKDINGKPVLGAVATFTSQDKTQVLTVTTFSGMDPTQPAGNFFLPNVPPTNFTAIAAGPANPNGKPEYTGPFANGALTAGSAPDAPYTAGLAVQANTTTGDGSTQGGPPVTFTLTPILPSITGRVIDTSVAGGGAAAGLAGATVTLTNSAGAPVGASVTTAADGTYTLSLIPAGQAATVYTITATLAGFNVGSRSVSVFLGDTLTGQDIALTPPPKGNVNATVNDQSGAPVPGATVTLVSQDGTVTRTSGPTAANGTVTISGVPPTTYNVTAAGPNNPNGRPISKTIGTVTVTVVSGQTVTPPPFVVVPVPPSFSGTVSNGTAPLANATITVRDAGGNVIGTPVRTGADGTYTTGPLPLSPPGGATYTVTASLAGFNSVVLNGGGILVYNGDALTGQNFTLTAQAPVPVSGTVKDTSGNPVPGVTVTFVSQDGTVKQSATTGFDGSYTLAAVPPSVYNVTAVSPNNANGKPKYVNGSLTGVVIPSTGPVSFTLTPILATVSGQVTDAGTGAGLAGATITFAPAAGPTVTLTADGSGNYAAKNLPPSTYTVTASQPGYFNGTATVTVDLGDVLTQSFALGQKATLGGLVTDKSTGAVLTGVTITVTDATGKPVATIPTPLLSTTSTAGPDNNPINYLATLTPGAYTITASKPGYDSLTLPTNPPTLTNAPFTRLDFQLTSSSGSLGGLVTNSTDTTPVAGATVTVTSANKTVAAQFTTSGSTSPGPDNAPLNYQGVLLKGTYTVTVTKGNRTPVTKTVTIIGGQFNRLDFTGATGGLPPLYTFPAGLQFVSTVYDYSALGFDGLFGPLNQAARGATPTPGSNRSHVAVWDPTAAGGGAYALDPTPPADALRLGVGYWVFLKNPVPVTQQGGTPTQAAVSVPLHPVWNQIGVPNPKGVPVASLLFDNGTGGTITFAQAVSGQYHIVSPTLYRYDGANYQPVTQSDILQPWQGYWIKVFADATLEIPTR